jgi:hypothetical protein
MKGNYLTTNVLLACVSKTTNRKKDIHTQLKETIAEHRKIMREFEKIRKKQYGILTSFGREAA